MKPFFLWIGLVFSALVLATSANAEPINLSARAPHHNCDLLVPNANDLSAFNTCRACHAKNEDFVFNGASHYCQTRTSPRPNAQQVARSPNDPGVSIVWSAVTRVCQSDKCSFYFKKVEGLLEDIRKTVSNGSDGTQSANHELLDLWPSSECKHFATAKNRDSRASAGSPLPWGSGATKKIAIDNCENQNVHCQYVGNSCTVPYVSIGQRP